MGDRRVIHLVDDEESIRKAASFALKTAVEELPAPGVMADLQKKEDDLRTTLMRISGAIQVLEELLATEAAGQDAAEAGGPRLVAN